MEARLVNSQTDSHQPLDSLLVGFVSLVFFLLGIGAFGLLVLIFGSNPAINHAITSHQRLGAITWTTIRSLGFILPLVICGFSLITFNLSWRLWRRDVNAAAWARQILLWLLLLVGVLVLQSLDGRSALPGVQPDTLPLRINFTLVWLLLGLVVVVCLWLLSTHLAHAFRGKEADHVRSERTAWNLLLPTLVILGLIGIYPLEQIFIASLTDQEFASTAEGEFIGLDNYARLLSLRIDALPCQTDEQTGQCKTRVNGQGQTETQYVNPLRVLDEGYRAGRYREFMAFDLAGTHYSVSARDPVFIKAFWDTVVFTIISVILELLLGLLLATILVSRFRGVDLMRVVILIPWAVPTIVSTQFWNIMLRGDQSGVINSLLLSLGLLDRSQSWFTNPDWQLPMMILVDVWKTTPSMAIMLMPGLLTIPRDIYQAAEVDGAGRVQRLFRITPPLLVPSMAVAIVFRSLNAIRVFDVFQILVGRGRFSLATYTQEVLVQGREVGYSSAIGVIIFFIIVFFVYVYMRSLSVDAD
ncbi:MAG TPA: sugar ABC transporter permease [Phototrophicaceae bacterium]|nr:sugar ABC transporter permease [Phototrophicaceae bacterium]